MADPIIYLRETPGDQMVRQLLPDYPHGDLQGVQLYLLLLRVAHELVGRVEQRLAAGGLSRGRLAVLMILRSRAGTGTNAAALAHSCGVTRATMTGLLRGLDNGGLIRRVAHNSDRRMSQVYISPKGQQMLRKILPDYYDLLHSFTRRLDRGQLTRLNSGLITLLEQLTAEKQTNGTAMNRASKKSGGAPLGRGNDGRRTDTRTDKERLS